MRRIEVDVDEIVRLYTSGVRCSAIAKQLGCSASIVLARLEEAGVDRSRAAPLDTGALVRLYVDEGWSLNRLAEKYGVAASTIRSALVRRGVPLRTRVASLQPRGRLPAPRSVVVRAYVLGFVWGDLAVDEPIGAGWTVSVRGSTTHEAQRELVDGVFGSFGAVRWSESSGTWCVRVSLDSSFEFLRDKYADEVPGWVRGREAEAAFVAGYVDAEGSFGVYEGRARFKLDSYDAGVQAWISAWMDRSGITHRHRLVSSRGDARSDGGTYNGDLWRINVNDAFGLLRFAATLDPFLRHRHRRATMEAAVANVHQRLRSRAHV